MSNHEFPSTNYLTATNPQSPIPNQRLYAALYRPPTGESDGELEAIARDFSPRFQMHHSHLVVIDIAGLERLLGPAHAIGDELRKAVSSRGIRAHVAIAATQTAAIVLAHTRPGLTVIAAGDEAAALAAVAIGILAKCEVGTLNSASLAAPGRSSDPGRGRKQTADVVVQTFHSWGIRTLGELAALPDAELISRFGRGAVAWQMLARGVDQRPLIPTLDEERFEASLDLEWPIEGLEPLSFVLTRLLEPLCTRLERRDRGAAVLHVLLDLVKNDAATRRLELPTPMRDVRALRTLALLDLESHPPAAAIDRVTIVIEPTPGRIVQHRLFTRAHPTPEQLSTLLARLAAVIGQDRVGAPITVDTHRPGAFAMTPFATNHPAAGRQQSADFRLHTLEQPACALRRCRQPVPARVAIDANARPVRVTTERRGYTGGAVVQCAGPWKTSGEWWTSDRDKSAVHTSGSWDRDEWDVALGDGAVYRIFRDRASDAWFVDGIVD